MTLYNYSSMEQEDDDAEEHMKCEGCKNELPDRCECNSVIAAFHDVNKKLLELKLLERLTGDVVTSIVRQMIGKHVAETCNGSFTASYIKSLSEWLDSVVMLWIRLVEKYFVSKKRLKIKFTYPSQLENN